MTELGVWTGQLIIAPRYHDGILDEAEKSGRAIENIMAERVENYPGLQSANAALLTALKDVRHTLVMIFEIPETDTGIRNIDAAIAKAEETGL